MEINSEKKSTLFRIKAYFKAASCKVTKTRLKIIHKVENQIKEVLFNQKLDTSELNKRFGDLSEEKNIL